MTKKRPQHEVAPDIVTMPADPEIAPAAETPPSTTEESAASQLVPAPPISPPATSSIRATWNKLKGVISPRPAPFKANVSSAKSFGGNRAIEMIEAEAERLAVAVVENIKGCDKTASYLEKVSADELKQKIFDVYSHARKWFLSKSEAEIDRYYRSIAARRAEQGVPLSQVIWSIRLIKDNLAQFVIESVEPGDPDRDKVLAHIEKFYSLAIYYAAASYEDCMTRSPIPLWLTFDRTR